MRRVLAAQIKVKVPFLAVLVECWTDTKSVPSDSAIAGLDVVNVLIYVLPLAAVWEQHCSKSCGELISSNGFD